MNFSTRDSAAAVTPSPLKTAEAVDVRCWGDADNLDEWRRELGLPASCATETVVLGVYRRFGKRTPEMFEGSFGAAVVDRQRNSVLAWSDRFGFLPLFYREASGGVLVDADQRRLLRPGDVADVGSVTRYLAKTAPQADRTFVAGISRIAAGCALHARGGQLSLERYYGPPYTAPDVASMEELQEEFASALGEALQRSLRSCAPAALWLSGGFDSTALASLICQLPPAEREQLGLAVSGVFPGLGCDERQRIEGTRRALSLRHRYVEVVPRGVPVAEVERGVVAHCGPYVNPQGPFFDAMIAAGVEQGATGILTGIGGDELTVDYRYQVDWLRGGGWRAPVDLWRQMRRDEHLGALTGARKVASQMGVAYLPALASRRASLRARTPLQQHPFLPPALRHHGVPETIPVMEGVRVGSHTAVQRYVACMGQQSQEGRQWWRRELSSRGQRLSTPFLTRRVVDAVLGTPQRLHPRTYPEGQYKPLLVRSLHKVLPASFSTRYWKVTFCDLEHAIGVHSAPELASYVLDHRSWLTARYVNVAACRDVLGRVARDPKAADPQVVDLVMRLAGAEAFLRSLQ